MLVKPQFEAGPGQVGAKGVVRDPEVHRAVCEQVVSWLGTVSGWTVLGVTESPVRGPEGNVEFLLAAEKPR
jgi:23S rRNA (cytidine1920-2'-O)/16S rRNA (cytidine1409-2'-O)-methyltransferase